MNICRNLGPGRHCGSSTTCMGISSLAALRTFTREQRQEIISRFGDTQHESCWSLWCSIISLPPPPPWPHLPRVTAQLSSSILALSRSLSYHFLAPISLLASLFFLGGWFGTEENRGRAVGNGGACERVCDLSLSSRYHSVVSSSPTHPLLVDDQQLVHSFAGRQDRRTTQSGRKALLPPLPQSRNYTT